MAHVDRHAAESAETAGSSEPAESSPRFAVVRHGFDRAQVQRRIDWLEQRVQQAEAERDQARAESAELGGRLAIAQREIAALTERLDQLGAAGPSETSDERVTRVLELARSQAEEITARAETAAENTWAAAAQAASALRDRYQRILAELDEQQADLAAEHESAMAAAKAKATELTTEAEHRRQRIDDEAEQDRVRIDREFSESMAARREALAEEVAAAKAENERDVERRLAAADEEARRRVDSVTDQVERLTVVRDKLAGQLRGTHDLLEQTAALLQSTEQEDAEPTEPEAADEGYRPPAQRTPVADEPAARPGGR